MIFYVATISRRTVIEAEDAEEAAAKGKKDPMLAGGRIVTVRIATSKEIAESKKERKEEY